MPDRAVLDTNVLVALVDRLDKWHAPATALLARLHAEGVRLVYLDCVLNETISVLARRADEQNRSEQFPLLLDDLVRRVPEDVITWSAMEVRGLYGETVALVRENCGALNFHDALIALFCATTALPSSSASTRTSSARLG